MPSSSSISSPSTALRSEAGLNSPALKASGGGAVVSSSRRSSGGAVVVSAAAAASSTSTPSSSRGSGSVGGFRPNNSAGGSGDAGPHFTMREVQRTPGGSDDEGSSSAVPAALASLLHQSDRSGKQNEASPSQAQINASSPSERRTVAPETSSGDRRGGGGGGRRGRESSSSSFWGSIFSCCNSSSALPVADGMPMASSSSSSSSSSMQRGGASVVSPARSKAFSVRHEALDVRMGGGGEEKGAAGEEGERRSPHALGDEDEDLTSGANSEDHPFTPSKVLSPTSLTARSVVEAAYAKQAVPPWGSRHPSVVHMNMLAHSRGAAAVAAHQLAIRTAGELPKSPIPKSRPEPPVARINNVRRPASSTGTGPLLAPVLDCDIGKPCLVLDLDETLVHSVFKPVPNPDYVLPVEVEGVVHYVYVCKRPGCDIFLEQLGKIYEIVIFTASLTKYADPLLDKLDTANTIRSRLFREACVYHEGNFVKDLSLLGRDARSTIIVDNSPASYLFQPENALACDTFIDDQSDRELYVLLEFLEEIRNAPDLRVPLQQWASGTYQAGSYGGGAEKKVEDGVVWEAEGEEGEEREEGKR